MDIRKKIEIKKGVALILCAAIFAYISRLLLESLNIDIMSSVSDYSALYVVTFILSMALLFSITYLLAYFIIHISSILYNKIKNHII